MRTAPLKDDPSKTPAERTTLCMWAVREAIAECEPRDFRRFAELCHQFSAPLGAVVALHADAADGNSPDLPSWATTTFQVEFPAVMDMTAEQARTWWDKQYSC